MLPPLDTIGLEKDEHGGAGAYGSMGRSSSRRGTGSGMPPPNRATSMGGAAMPFNKSQLAAGGFSMGNFQPPSRLTSEERFLASSGGRSASTSGPFGPGVGKPAPLVRSISQGGPGGPPSPKDGHHQTGRIRSSRGKQRGAQSNQQQYGTPSGGSELFLDPVAPLQPTDSRWSRQAQPSDQHALVERKVKALLNKLTVEKFENISNQIIEWANKSEQEKDGRTLIQVIKLVFEKATDEATWSEMYAKLCRKMMEKISANVQDDSITNTEGKPITGGQLFRKYLLNRCQEDFERGWNVKEAAVAAAAARAAEDQAAKEVAENLKDGEVVLYSEEYYIAQKAKRQGLGLVKFIGELFKLQMLTERIMHECIKKLLSNVEDPEEEEIESLCKLLTTVGGALDTTKARNHMDIYFGRMSELARNTNINSRMQYMLLVCIVLTDG